MKRVDTFEQYNAMIVNIKMRITDIISNNYLLPDSVLYYIDRGLLYYDIHEDCLMFFVDQKKYYSLYIIGSSKLELKMYPLDYPVLIDVVCKDIDDENIWNNVIDKDGSFVHKCSLQGFDYDPREVMSHIDDISSEARIILNRDGFELVSPNLEMYDKLYGFIEGIEEIPYWNIAYRSHKDFIEDYEKGLVKCILDSNRDICGAYYRYVYGRNEYGWIAIDERYRKWTGLSVVLTADMMDGIIHRGHKGKGWIDYNNKSSIRYHTHIGYHPNGRIKKEYLFEK